MENEIEVSYLTFQGLQMFKGLIKCGALWEGDLGETDSFGKTWSEYLVVTTCSREEVLDYISKMPHEGQVFKCEYQHFDGISLLVGVWVA